MESNQDWIVLKFSSLGRLYVFLNESDFSPKEVFDLIPTVDGAILLLVFSANQKRELVLKEGDVRGQVVRDVPASLMRAALGAENPPLGESLCVVDSGDIGLLVEAAKRCLSVGLEVFDFRILRGGDTRGYFYATGARSREPLLMDLCVHSSVLSSPNALVRSFFQIHAH